MLALFCFPLRSAVVVVFNALMGLPPVVVGLAVYLLLSRSGPLGGFGILFTPSAMVIAQTILIVADHCGAGRRQTVRGSLGRVPRRTDRDGRRSGRAHHDICCGMPASAC